jgi:hypothetical protein
MAIDRQYIEQGWLDGAIRHLNLLCQETKGYEDEGDIVPTDIGISSAKELMSQVAKSSQPRIVITVNGEILLSWHKDNNNLKAIVATDGTVKFYKNHVPLDRLMFVRYINTSIAA